MLEWYKTNVKFDAFIDETLGLLRFTHEQFVSQYLNETISFKFPEKFEKWTLKEVFQEFVGLELIDLDPDLSAKARERGVVSVGKLDDFETAFFKILIEKIEPKLEKLPGVVLYDYPASQAALAIVEGGVAKRFEVYINGIELCNGFKELLDHHENKIRIQEANILREQKGKEKVLEDLAFLESLKMPIPTTCGNALGLERWLALLQGAGSLDAVIPFRGQFPFNNERFPGSVCSSTINEPIASDFSTQTI
jgi:lysyl-tRNA synthetase class 2